MRFHTYTAEGFGLARGPYLVQFVRKVREIAHGKAYFTSTLSLPCPWANTS